MFGGLTIQSFFLIVIGAVIFVVGTNRLLKKQIRNKMGKLLKDAKIISLNHVTKKDDERLFDSKLL